MKHIKLFESWIREETIDLESRSGKKIVLEIKNGKIEAIENLAGVRFPFFEGQLVTVFMKGWACQNGFTWNGKDPCEASDKKVFGIKTKDIPKGHYLRSVFPSKFRD